MAMHKPVHPILNNRWLPVVGFLVGILVSHLWGIGADVWRGYYKGTIYGTVVMVNADGVPQPVENVEISFDVINASEQCKPVLTNSQGEYRFDDVILVGYHVEITAKYENDREFREIISEIEGVKWLFGIRRLWLPISSGVPTRVDFTIPVSRH